ncbi:MAG TPA: serine hydrolase domain-containing protein [Chitinophaga sp.]|uniref:serine hydrolase domain-containing protein n=1 Tax=Chitinophaga sp. TaxID=1869181 RepID=UPI002F9292A3
MTLRTLIFISLFTLTWLLGSGQTKPEQLRIKAVENGLMETRQVVFADSITPKYNITERMKFYKVPSVSIAVINNGSMIWAKAYGYADAAARQPANTGTLYQAASISKSVNASGIMKLVQDGKLSLDKDIREYLKTWTFPDNEFSKGKTITLKNLLSHTAGLSTGGFMGYTMSDSIPAINQILNGQKPANSEAVKPVLPVGAQFKYSGGGTVIIRKILEDNISSNYDSIMQAAVLKPLKMTSSTFSQPLNHQQYKNFAAGHDTSMQVLQGKFNIYPELAPDGLWTTATDLAKFVIAIQQSLKNTRPSFLEKAVAEKMLTPVLSSSDAALGTFILEKGGEKYFTHSGANVGYRTDYYGSFTTGNGVVVLTNSENGQALIDEIINSVATVYQWKDFYNPMVMKSIHVPDTLLEKYAGDYFSEDPQIKISIVKKGNSLELTARRPEKMYATGLDTFFLMSSPTDKCIFSSSQSDGVIDLFEVKQEEKVVVRAVKRR